MSAPFQGEWEAYFGNTMDQIDERVTEKFDEFKKDQEPARVYEAIELIEEAQRKVQTWDAASWERIVSYWLHFIAVLDRFVDSKWDPNDVPEQGAPLPSTHGVIYPSGDVDPKTIPDPVARAQYVEALKANEESRKRYGVQFQLHRIEARSMGMLELLLTGRFADPRTTEQKFEEMLASSSLSEACKQRLQALLPK